MIQKLPKTIQGEIYQFLDRRELARMEVVCKKLQAGAKQDFLWRYLAQNTLEMASSKHFGELWKQYYLRSSMSQDHQTKERFNYLMCAIRHFKEVVTAVDSYNNFVFAADTSGKVGIFLVHEKDLENDEDTLTAQSLDFPDGVEYLHHQVKNGDQQLVIVSGSAAVHTYGIELTGPGSFTFGLLSSIQLPFTTPSNLYVCPLNETQIFVSNYPLDGTDFMKDQTICIFDTNRQQVVHTQQLAIADEASNYNLTQALNSMGVYRPFFGGGPQMRRQIHFGNQFQPMPIAQYKAERNQKQRLAVFNGSRLVVSLFNNQLAVIETQMSAMEAFLKGTNYTLVQPVHQENEILAMDLRLHRGVLLAYNLHNVKVIDFQTMQLVEGHDLGAGSCPISQISLNPQTDSYSIVRKLNNQLEVITMKINVAEKKIVLPIARQESDEVNQINDIDSTRHIIASATGEGGVKFRRLAEFGNPYFINASSKTVKTYKSHPTKQGVSLVRIMPNKVIVVLGNLIRVYSFDFVRVKK